MRQLGSSVPSMLKIGRSTLTTLKRTARKVNHASRRAMHVHKNSRDKFSSQKTAEASITWGWANKGPRRKSKDANQPFVGSLIFHDPIAERNCFSASATSSAVRSPEGFILLPYTLINSAALVRKAWTCWTTTSLFSTTRSFFKSSSLFCSKTTPPV